MLNRRWLSLLIVIVFLLGFLGGYFTNSYLKLDAAKPVTRDYASAVNNELAEIISQGTTQELQSAFGSEGTCSNSDWPILGFPSSLLDIAKFLNDLGIGHDCMEIVYKKFNFKATEFRRDGTDPIEWSDSKEDGAASYLKKAITAMLTGQDPPSGDLEGEPNIDTWVHFEIDMEWTMTYYDDNCELQREQFTAKEDKWVRAFSGEGGGNGEVRDKPPKLKGYTQARCTDMKMKDPIIFGSLDDCKRCKKVPPAMPNNVL